MFNRCRGCALGWPLFDSAQVPQHTVSLLCETHEGKTHVPMTAARKSLSPEQLDAAEALTAITGDLAAVDEFVSKQPKKS